MCAEVRGTFGPLVWNLEKGLCRWTWAKIEGHAWCFVQRTFELSVVPEREWVMIGSRPCLCTFQSNRKRPQSAALQV